MKRILQLWCFVLFTALGCTESNETQHGPSIDGRPQIGLQEPSISEASQPTAGFDEWIMACQKLPTNLQQGFRVPPKHVLPLKSFAELELEIDGFFGWSTNGVMNLPSHWVGEKPTEEEFFNTSRVYYEQPAIPFQPFAQKLSVPAGTEVVFHGDFHGDIHSLVQMVVWLNGHGYLNGFKISRSDVHLVFLGDYTDRGIYGAEVIYTLLKLKTANPDRVWMIRGNHEDIGLTSRYGFLQEFVSKFGQNRAAIRKISRIYDFMPVALYLGIGDNWVQCNHGGLEPGFDPSDLLSATNAVQFQFLGLLRQAQFIHRHPEILRSVEPLKRVRFKNMFADFVPQSPTSPSVLGFMWNDFSLLGDEPAIDYDSGRAWVFGRAAADAILGNAGRGGKRVRAVFRAHQHSGVLNPMMRRLRASNGLYRHWQERDSSTILDAENKVLRDRLDHNEIRSIPDGSVWTFNVAPDSVYGKNCDYTFDSFGILSVRERFDQWTIRVVNLNVVQ